jgi:hypothetical protein
MFVEMSQPVKNTNVVTKIDYPMVVHFTVYMSESQTTQAKKDEIFSTVAAQLLKWGDKYE